MVLEHFEKAKEKIDKYQRTSDIATDENENVLGKRSVNKPKKYRTESESSDEGLKTVNKKIPQKPPTILKDTVRSVNKSKKCRTESESSDEGLKTVSKKILPQPPTILKDNVSNKCNTVKAVRAQDEVILSTSTSESHSGSGSKYGRRIRC